MCIRDRYWKSPRFERLAPATKKHYSYYRVAIEGKVLANDRTFGEVPLDKLTRGVIAKYRDSMADAQFQANRHLQFMGGVFSYALELEYMTINPVTGVEKFRTLARDHYIEDKDYWLAFELAPDWIKAAMELAYLCRGRKGEILALTVKGHLLENGIYLKRTKGSNSEVTKWSDRLRAAVELAKTHHRAVISPFLLHGSDGQKIKDSAFNSAWQRMMKKFHAAGGVHFTFHDIKAKGVTDHTEHASGHKSERAKAIYIRKPDLVAPTR